jgi:hypothetical protein
VSVLPVLLVTGALALGAAALAQEREAGAVVPLRGIYYTAGDITAAREAIAREPWRAEMLQAITEAAGKWAAMSDDDLRALLPPPGSFFAYGTSGCPACGASWKHFGAETCSLEDPGKVVCQACKRVFPDPDPASPFHDAGKGFTADGKSYYPTGIWNGFVIQKIWSAFDEESCALNALVHAYALTGRDEYARKALMLMDALATLSPTTIGPRDFAPNSSQTSVQGRLHFLTSIVYRAMVTMARNTDILGRHPMMQEPSGTAPGRTVLQNIRAGLFEDYLFKHGDVREGKLSTLHNHEADSVRAMLVTGILFGEPDYVRWGMDGLDSLVANTIDRDGMYYETSMGYSDFSRGVFGDMAELCANYSPSNYGGESGSFPEPRNFFDNPRLAALSIENSYVTVAGRELGFGNAGPNAAVVTSPPANASVHRFNQAARFAAYSSDSVIRARAAALMEGMMAGRDAGQFHSKWWLLKRPDAFPAAPPKPVDISPVGSGKFFSTRAMAAFQSGDWPNRRGFVLRGGPNLPHAHDDLLGLNFWDLGREMAAEIGYGTFGSHVHHGWGRRAIAHNLVVVDMDAGHTEREIYKNSPGADWRSFYDGGWVKYVDADARGQFELERRVSEYRRRFAMIEIDAKTAYYIDLFDVTGGSVRDYSFHAPYNDDLKAGQLALKGVGEDPVPGAWTLAGLSPEWRGEPWNAPGKSWGERVTPGEYIRKLSPDDGVGLYTWAPPGMGYGFLYDLRGGKTSSPWSAYWTLAGDDGAQLLATFLPDGEQEAYRACAPDLTGKHVLNYVICRDSGAGRARFLTVIEPYLRARAVRQVRRVPDTGSAVVIEVTHPRGVDYVMLAGESGRATFRAKGGLAVSLDGEFAVLRLSKSGQPSLAASFRARSLECGGERLIRSVGVVRGTVLEAGKDALRVRLAEGSRAQDARKARFCVASSPHYRHNTAFGLDAGALESGGGALTVRTGPVSLQRLSVAKVDSGSVESHIPLPLGFIYGASTRFLDGKTLADASGKTAGRLDECTGLKSFSVDEGFSAAPGDVLEILDIAAGDAIEFPLPASWKR